MVKNTTLPPAMLDPATPRSQISRFGAHSFDNHYVRANPDELQPFLKYHIVTENGQNSSQLAHNHGPLIAQRSVLAGLGLNAFRTVA